MQAREIERVDDVCLIPVGMIEIEEGAALIALLIGSSAEAESGANRMNRTNIDITYRIQTSSHARIALDLFEELFEKTIY